MKTIIEKVKSFFEKTKKYKVYVTNESLEASVISNKTYVKIVAIAISVVALLCYISYIGGKHAAEADIIATGELSYYEIPICIYVDGIEPVEFSEENLVDMLKKLNVKYPDVVLAQAQIESGYYTSHIFHDNNNLFGMKEAKCRIHTHEGTQHGHAKYGNWQQCVIDYAFYQASYLNKIESKEQYIEYLNKSYAEVGDRYGNMIRKKLPEINELYKF